MYRVSFFDAYAFGPWHLAQVSLYVCCIVHGKLCMVWVYAFDTYGLGVDAYALPAACWR